MPAIRAAGGCRGGRNERLEREADHVTLEAAGSGMTAARQGRADRTHSSSQATASGSASARILPSAWPCRSRSAT